MQKDRHQWRRLYRQSNINCCNRSLGWVSPAAQALGGFSGNTLTVDQATVVVAPPEEIPSLLGDPEEIVVGVHFCISGDLDGYLLAYFNAADALLLVESLLGRSPVIAGRTG